jgi:ribonuclease P protein component
MLSLINRIKKKKDFELIFKNSKSFKNNIFILKIAKNDLGISRVGLVISKKVSKKAVIRNKIRRRLSEAVKLEINNIKAGMDLVLIVLPEAEKKDFSEIKEAVKNAFIKINKNV